MAYTVIYDFVDTKDDNLIYKAGDVYPANGKKPTQERIKELSSDDNYFGKAVIAKGVAARTEASDNNETSKT